MPAKLGIDPIVSSDDDMPELADDTPPKTRLAHAATAGPTGVTHATFAATAGKVGFEFA